MEITREEHLKWCKERAIKELEFSNDPSQALISMMSDLGKHPETADHSGIMLTTMLLMSGHLRNKNEVIKHIQGFN